MLSLGSGTEGDYNILVIFILMALLLALRPCLLTLTYPAQISFDTFQVRHFLKSLNPQFIILPPDSDMDTFLETPPVWRINLMGL